MIDLMQAYLDSSFVDYVLSWLGLFPAAVLLGCLAWGVSYLVYGLFGLFRV